MSKNKKLYYGYISTFLAMVTFFGSSGILNYSSGNIIQEVIVNRGWAADKVSLVYTMRTVLSVCMPLVGWAVNKFGPRKCIGLTTIVTSACLIGTAFCNDLLAFTIVYGFAVSFSMMFNDSLACMAVVNNWWTTRRGEFGGYMNGAGALGGIIFPIVVALMFTRLGWKTTMCVLGVLLLVMTAIPQMIWMKDHPEDVGQEIEGGRQALEQMGKEEEKMAEGVVNWKVKDALRTKPLWLWMVGWGTMLFSYAGFMYYSQTKFVMEGMSAVSAARYVTILNVVMLVIAFALARAVDKIGAKRFFIIALLLCAVGSWLFVFAGKNTFCYFASMMAGIAFVMVQSIMLNLLPTYYGPKNYAAIQGAVFWMPTVFSSIANIMYGQVLARTGSLDLAFKIAAILCVGGAITICFVKAPKIPEKYLKQANAAE